MIKNKTRASNKYSIGDYRGKKYLVVTGHSIKLATDNYKEALTKFNKIAKASNKSTEIIDANYYYYL